MNELIEKYKDQKLEFDRYYKYDFFYANDVIIVKAGGDGNDIYRSEMGRTMTLEEIVNECGTEFMEIWEVK